MGHQRATPLHIGARDNTVAARGPHHGTRREVLTRTRAHRTGLIHTSHAQREKLAARGRTQFFFFFAARTRRSRLGGSCGVPVLVPMRATQSRAQRVSCETEML